MKLNKAIFLLLVCVNSYSASFDCSKASTEIDKTICENDWIGSLDEELSLFYTKLRESLSKEESSILLSEQREWIRERNKSCETAYNKKSCLSDRYRKRVNTLKIRYEEPLLPSKDNLKEMCDEISELDASGRRKYGDSISTYDIDKDIMAYDINNDGIKEIAERCYGGTMRTPCIRFKNMDGSKIQRKTINYEWKTYWTYGLKVFSKEGKWFRLHSYDDNLVKPVYVSYMTPENNEYVVCEFENKEVEQFLPSKSVIEANEVCSAIMEGDSSKIINITLFEKPIISRSDVSDLGRYATGLERQGYLDYNNDGSPNYIGELEYTSGAGRGCEYNYFDELSEDRKLFIESEDRSLLLKMQKVNLKGRHPNCGNWREGKYMNHFFSFNEKIYFEHKTRTERAIFKLENDKIHEICSVEKSYKTSVKSVGVPNK